MRFGVISFAALLAAYGCSNAPPPAGESSASVSQPVVATSGAVARAPGKTGAATGAGANTSYGGGPLLSNVQIVSVFWTSNVNSQVQSQIGGFYSAVTSDEWMDSLNEYDSLATTTPHPLGRGSLAGTFTITPQQTATTLTSDQVGTEIANQVNAGNLPAPNANTLYMVHFPPGDTLIDTRDGNIPTCQDIGGGTTCAFHDDATKTINGVSTTIAYGLMPDFGPGSGCEVCGASTMFNNFTAVASHEMAEAITDPQPFSGWVTEIGDPCEIIEGQVFSGSTSYTVQRLFSKASDACMLDSNPRAISAVSRGSGLLDVLFQDSSVNLDEVGALDSGSLSGPLGSAPFSITRGNQIDTFVAGSNGSLFTKQWRSDTGWSDFMPLGPETFQGAPVAVSPDGTQIFVFVHGNDGALWRKISMDGGKSYGDYQQLETSTFVGNPVVTSWGPNRIDVFVRGTDSTLYWKFFDGTNWSDYQQLESSQIVGSPSAVTWGPNRLDVFVRGTDGTVYWKTGDGTPNGWGSYNQLGTGQLIGSPTGLAVGVNHLLLFVHGMDDNLYAKMGDGTLAGWGKYSNVEPGAMQGTPAAAVTGTNSAAVVIRGTDSAFYQATTTDNGNTWNGGSGAFVGLGGSAY